MLYHYTLLNNSRYILLLILQDVPDAISQFPGHSNINLWTLKIKFANLIHGKSSFYRFVASVQIQHTRLGNLSSTF